MTNLSRYSDLRGQKDLHHVRLILFCSLLFGLGLFAASASATNATSAGVGGPGGAPFAVYCGESGVLVGITGRSGVVIDQVGGLCVKIDPISGVWVGSVYETARQGGNGGQPFNKRCPVGQAVLGIDATINDFNGTPVVGSLEIKCIELGIHNSTIEGMRTVDVRGDPAPLNNQAIQDYCDPLRASTGHYEKVWSPVGVALSGGSGTFVDRIHLECMALLHDNSGYRVAFEPRAGITVPEGTPIQISWRASGVKPELTPNLQYSWTLMDWTHTQTVFGIPAPTTVSNPCSYAMPPCSTFSSSVTYYSLPPAVYELDLGISPASDIISTASYRFTVLENLLESLTFFSTNVRAGMPINGSVTMEGPAPPKGRVLYISSSNPDLLPVPPVITVPGGFATVRFTLRANNNPGSADQVTITVSTRPPLAEKLSRNTQGILSRGLDEPEQENPGARQAIEPPEETGETTTNAEKAPDGEVTERGLSSIQIPKKSSGIQRAIPSAPAAVLPPLNPRSQMATAAPQGRPDTQTADLPPSKLVNRPSETKSAVISVAPPFGTPLPGK
jgi:hypothetical protein